MISNSDTIAAISTPPGESGIGIVRISGKECENILKKLFKPKSNIKTLKSHTMYYGKIFEPEGGEQIDEILAVLMKGPKTYTREDCLEFHCHGGPLILKKVLESVIRVGARLAEPGEFTKRAFLNGRIDLAQAEAVIDVIRSRTDKGLRYAQKQLDGKLSENIKAIRNNIIDILSEIEAFIDFHEEGIELPSSVDLIFKLDFIIKNLKDYINSYNQGKIFKEGVNSIILGKPNVGKSSLFNKLLNKERAIVTEYPGTTRDLIEDFIIINGIMVKLIDTAGIRESNDIIEDIGHKMRDKTIPLSDLVIFVLDVSENINEDDLKLINSIESRKRIIVLNKIDLISKYSKEFIYNKTGENYVYEISALKGIGIEELKNGIAEKIFKNELDNSYENILTNLRHKYALEEAINMLDRAMAGIKNNIFPELIAFELRGAISSIGKILGETVSEEILDKIFNEFCIGK